jgi:rod shape-determining protein MreC
MASLFRNTRSHPVWLAVLMLAAFGLYLADVRLHLLEGLRGGLLSLLEPAQRLVAAPGQFWVDTQEALRSREALELENKQLKQEQKLLQAQMQTFWSVEQENKRLRIALNASLPLEMDLMLAKVLRSADATQNPTILIDRGAQDEVYVGQAALLGTGVLGQVLHVGAHTAEIIPLTDEQHSIPVRVARSGQRGVVRGTGLIDELRVQYLPRQADVVVGDVLLTSGLGGGFPEGFPVASVTQISTEQSGAFAGIRARPLAAIHDVREIVLVWMRKPNTQTGKSFTLPPTLPPLPTAPTDSALKPPTHAQ